MSAPLILPYVWPEDQLAPLLVTVAELRKSDEPPSPKWWAELDDSHDNAARIFTEANGWSLVRRDVSPTALARGSSQREALRSWRRSHFGMFEHTNWLCAPGRRVFGGVIHVYGGLQVEDAPDFIAIDELPASWYWPGLATAYLVRRAIVR